MSQFIGSWKLVESHFFDEYMKAVDIPWITRKAACALKPVLTFHVSDDGKHWKFTSTSTFKTHTTEFDLGQEFKEETIDGRLLKSTFTYDGKKLIQNQVNEQDQKKSSYFERYVDDDGKLVIKCTCGDVECIRKYEKEN